MSIWANKEHVGTDDRVDGYPPNNRGQVLSYPESFSNHYRSRRQPRAAAMCSALDYPLLVRARAHGRGGHRDFRALDSARRPHHEHDEDGWPTGARKSAAVVLDIEAAVSLAKDPTEWANRSTRIPGLDELEGLAVVCRWSDLAS